MRRLLLLSAVALVSCSRMGWTDAAPLPAETVEERIRDGRWESLVSALSYVESRNDDNARNPSSSATGRWQMTRIYVDEVNRIQGLRNNPERFAYDDRRDSATARRMFDIFQSYYNPEKDIKLAIRLHRGKELRLYEREVLRVMKSRSLSENAI